MIQDLLYKIKSGARSNKYRVIIPAGNNWSKDIDTLIQSTNLPSRTITPVEVYLRGRKVQLRGETNLENTWDMTFYNSENMEERAKILEWMEQIHRNQYNLSSFSYLSQGIAAAKSIYEGVKNLINDPLSLFNSGVVKYQKDITIEQLDSDGKPTFKVILIGAFPINMSAVEYDDSTSDISKSTCTFAFTDIKYESGSMSMSDIERILKGF